MVLSPASQEQKSILSIFPSASFCRFDVDQIDSGRRSMIGIDTQENASQERSFSSCTTGNDALKNEGKMTLELPCPTQMMEILYHTPYNLSRAKAVVRHGVDLLPAESRPSQPRETFTCCVLAPKTSCKKSYGTLKLNTNQEINRIVAGSAENKGAMVIEIHQRAAVIMRKSDFSVQETQSDQVPLGPFSSESFGSETESDTGSEVIPSPTRFNWQYSDITMSDQDLCDDTDVPMGSLFRGTSSDSCGGRPLLQKHIIRRWNPVDHSAKKRDCHNLPPQRKDSRDSWDDLFYNNDITQILNHQFDSIEDPTETDFRNRATSFRQPFMKNKKDCSVSPATKTTVSTDTLSISSSRNYHFHPNDNDNFTSRGAGDSPMQVPQRSLSPHSLMPTSKIQSEQLLNGYDGDCEGEIAFSPRMFASDSCRHKLDGWNSFPIISPTNNRLKTTGNDGPKGQQLSPWELLQHNHDNERQPPLRMPRRQRSLDLARTWIGDIPAPPFA
jgi:hypothetical protein